MISVTIISCQVTICGVRTQDVLNKSLLELMKLSGCCGLTVQDLYHKCCLTQAVTPATVSAEDDDGYEGDMMMMMMVVVAMMKIMVIMMMVTMKVIAVV